MDKFTFRHQGVCNHCGHIAESRETSTFVTPFFMPDHCPGCGKYMSSDDFNNKDWKFLTLKYEWVKPEFVVYDPRTWFGSYKLISKE